MKYLKFLILVLTALAFSLSASAQSQSSENVDLTFGYEPVQSYVIPALTDADTISQDGTGEWTYTLRDKSKKQLKASIVLELESDETTAADADTFKVELQHKLTAYEDYTTLKTFEDSLTVPTGVTLEADNFVMTTFWRIKLTNTSDVPSGTGKVNYMFIKSVEE